MVDSEEEYLESVNNYIARKANVYAGKLQAAVYGSHINLAPVVNRSRLEVQSTSGIRAEKVNVNSSKKHLPIEQVSLQISSSSASFSSSNTLSALQPYSHDQTQPTHTNSYQPFEKSEVYEDVERLITAQRVAKQIIDSVPETEHLEVAEQYQVRQVPAARRMTETVARVPSPVERPRSPIPRTPSPTIIPLQRPTSRTRSNMTTRHVLPPNVAPPRTRSNVVANPDQGSSFGGNRLPPPEVLAAMHPQPIGTGWLPPYQTPPPALALPSTTVPARDRRQPRRDRVNRNQRGNNRNTADNFIEPLRPGDTVAPQLVQTPSTVPIHPMKIPTALSPIFSPQAEETTWLEISLERQDRRVREEDPVLDATEPIVASSSHFETLRPESESPRLGFSPMFADLTRDPNPQSAPLPQPPQLPVPTTTAQRPLSIDLLRKTAQPTVPKELVPPKIGVQKKTNPSSQAQTQPSVTSVTPAVQDTLPPRRPSKPSYPLIDNKRAVPIPSSPALPRSVPSTSASVQGSSGMSAHQKLLQTIETMPDFTIDMTNDAWDLHNSTYVARSSSHPIRKVAPEPVEPTPTGNRNPTVAAPNLDTTPPEQLAMRERMRELSSCLPLLTPTVCDSLSEEELVELAGQLYYGSPRQKFKETYPFLAEGVLQKDSQIANQLKVYSSRMGQISIPDRPDRKNHDYVWFLVVREGVYRGIYFNPHPKSLISAKFPSEDRIVIKGYALLGHAVNKHSIHSRNMTEGRWICWNDSMGVLSIASGAARTSMKKQPIWDKQLDVVSVQANYERNRFVVMNVVALTNLEEKKRMFPEDVFLVKDMVFRERCNDDLIFASADLQINVFLKSRLAENIKEGIRTDRQYQIVTAPAFRSSTRLEFRGILIIDDPNSFWCKDKEWVREKLMIQTTKYMEDVHRQK